MELPQNYDHKVSEKKWVEFWQDKKIFSFNAKSKKKMFSIDTPPPTLSGKMHVGHAFHYAHVEFIARYKRMQGFNVFYPFGTDDNGLPTEKLVEKQKNVRSSVMPRTEFRQLCYNFVTEELKKFSQAWKDLGISCDFTKPYSTIDKESQRISQEMFLDLYEKGMLKREKTPVTWDTYFQTSIAQAEFENIQKKSFFNDIVFKCGKKELIIATTRPELLPACVAVCFHPEDERYHDLKGKFATVPLFNYEVPILADETVDREKGTGLMMVCTFGDKEDIEKYFKYKLYLKMVITKDGHLNDLAGKYEGLTIVEGRKKIIEDLKHEGLLKKQEEIVHNVNVYEKSGREIEFMVTDQWFVKILDKKEELVNLGNKISWYPEHMKARYMHWVQNLNWDWCISRQRSFGVPFPVWYEKDTGKIVVASKDELPVDPTVDRPKHYKGHSELIPEMDVMDTWATSSLSPLLALERHGLGKEHIPMDVRPQAHDIIRTWAFYTIVRHQFSFKKLPWKNVMISGFVTDPHGEKMSKSKGNVVDPFVLMDKFGADVLRYWAAGAKLGEDTPYSEKDFMMGKKTVTKLWNAIKFTIMNLEGYAHEKPKHIAPMDAWLLSKLHTVLNNCTEAFEHYEYSKAKWEMENFFWATYCDLYLELVKDRIYNKDKYSKEEIVSAQWTLYHASLAILKVFAPIMPFITEELYQLYYMQFEKEESVALTSWPASEKKYINIEAETSGNIAVEIVNAVRKYKSEKQYSLKKEVVKIIVECKEKHIESLFPDVQAVCNAKAIELGRAKTEIREGLKVDVVE